MDQNCGPGHVVYNGVVQDIINCPPPPHHHLPFTGVDLSMQVTIAGVVLALGLMLWLMLHVNEADFRSKN